MVYSPWFGSNYATLPFKYLSQTIKTLRILFRTRPRIVYVMTPPVFACVPVWIYSRWTRAPFVIDAHTGAFLDTRWKKILFVHRWFSRSARMTIVTNEHMKDVLEKWRCRVNIVRDVPVCFARPAEVTLDGACNMTMVCTFTWDEPIALFFQAAARLPTVSFHVTGNYQRVDKRILDMRPDNVRLTGFLSDEEYVGLLLASDAVISLTTLDHTMQRAAYEAIYLGKPVITSDFEILRRHFYKGAVHVDNTVDGVIAGIRRMHDNLVRFGEEAGQLRLERLAEWTRVEAYLRGIGEECARNV